MTTDAHDLARPHWSAGGFPVCADPDCPGWTDRLPSSYKDWVGISVRVNTSAHSFVGIVTRTGGVPESLELTHERRTVVVPWSAIESVRRRRELSCR